MDVKILARRIMEAQKERQTDCVIWPGYPATWHELTPSLFRYYSPRAWIAYRISQETIDSLKSHKWFQDPSVAKMLTSYLIDEWLLDKEATLVAMDLIREIQQRGPLPVYTRAERLLRYLSGETFTVGEYIPLKMITAQNAGDTDSYEPTLGALAWSESENWQEIQFLLGHLKSHGWIQFDRDDGEVISCVVTVDGHSKIAEAETSMGPAQSVVGTRFDTSMDEAIEDDDESFLNKDFEIPSIHELPIASDVSGIIQARLEEAQLCFSKGAHLSVIFLCGSILEGVLLGAAQREPERFNRSSVSPKQNGKVKFFDRWSLSEFINVAHDIGLLELDVQKYSHDLRDFRNHIHPYRQIESGFKPDGHTAAICLQVLKAALASVAGKR